MNERGGDARFSPKAARAALQADLGPRKIQHAVRYTELSPIRFRDFGGIKNGP
jgi:hypothetical protein